VVPKANSYVLLCIWRILVLCLEPFPSPVVVVRITVGEDNVGFFTDKSSAIVRLRQTQNGDKVPIGLTLLAPQIGLEWISSSEHLYVTVT
jgi:hypothetical protein